MVNLLKSKIFRVAVVVAALAGLYALLGFYVAPKVIRSQAVAFVKQEYGRDLTVGEIRFNPFKLQLEINDLAFPDADRQTMLGCKRLFVDFELSSLWHRAYTFKDIAIEVPAIHAVIRAGGQVNLADLAPKDKTPPEPEPADDKMPSVWIQSLVVSHGHADYLDQERVRPYKHRFEPIEFSLRDFRTTPQGGQFGFSAVSQAGARIDWKGQFALEPGISSQGTFDIGNLPAPNVAEFLGDALPFGLTAGVIHLGGSYTVALGGTTDVKVDMPRIEMTGLALRARSVDTDWVTIPNMVVTETRVALPERTVGIGNITLTGMTAQVWKSPDGAFNLTSLFSPTPAPGDAAAAVPADAAATIATATAPATAATAPPVSDAPAWRVVVSSVDAKDAAVDLEDRTVNPAAKFALAPLNLGVKDISLDLAKPLPLVFDTTINGHGVLHGSGQIVPTPLAADIDLALDGFELTDIQPYLRGSTDMTIKAGTLGMKGQLKMTPPDSPAADMTIAGDATLSGFKSVDNALEQDFFNFERLDLTKLRYDRAPDAMSIDRVRLVKPFNRVIIGSNGIVNVSAVFDPVGTAAELKKRQAAAAATQASAGRKKTRAEIKAEKQAAAAAAKARASAPPAPQPELKETGMPIRIREFRLDNGRLDFADYSIQPNFAADITSLHGAIHGMSSDPKSRSKVDFKGKVGEFSPVTITGEVQPFAYERYTDIGMKFENISLPIFNPYSGRLAGYNISQGKLTTDLHYTIVDRKLDAKHHIRIDQLEWGEATASKGEATLPVKFATSLLKDAEGVIELDIPVTGTLDDPKFRVGPIIWQVIKNLITKAVTAPFKALGAMFKDAEQAQFVDFVPGQSALDAATGERLAGLARTLATKQDIRLKIPLGAVAEMDLAALTEQRYTAELQQATRRVLLGKKAAPDAPVPAFDTLDADRQIDVLTDMVTRLTGAEPQLPAAPERPEGMSRKDAKEAEQAAAIAFLAGEARSRLAPGAQELEQLGQARAEAIQRALLTDTGLAPERVFQVKDGKVTPQDGKARYELGME
jgi:hypothetical protein